MEKLNQAASDVADLLRLNSGLTSNDVDGLQGVVDQVLDIFHKIQEIRPPSIGMEKHCLGINVKWLLACIELLLVNLSEELSESEKEVSNYTLGAEEIKNISHLLQFVVKFGIVAFLERGVGRADSMPKSDMFSAFTPREKYKMLHTYTCLIYNLCIKSTTMLNLTAQILLTDLLASMMQICFSPVSARILDKVERQECMCRMNEIIQSWIAKDRLIEEILVLQGSLSNRVSPRWLQNKCGVMLSRILLEENGMKTVIMTLVRTLTGAEPGNCEGWEQVIALSSILTTLPATGISSEEYCELAYPQLLELLFQVGTSESESLRRVLRIVVTTIHALHEKYPKQSLVFEKLVCKPLLECCTDGDALSGQKSLLKSDEDFSNCIENLHQICVAVGVAPPSLLATLLVPYLKVIFTLMCDTQETSSHLTTLSADLLKAVLKSASHGDAATLVISTFGYVHQNDLEEISFKTPLEGLKFSTDEDGVVRPVISPNFDPSEVLHRQDMKVRVILDILRDSGVDGLVGDVFLLLLKNLCDPQKNTPFQVVEDGSILAQEDRAAQALRANEERFITFGLVSSLCESVDPNILLSDTSQMLHFVKSMLENSRDKLHTNDPQQSIESIKTYISVLGICLMSDLTSSQKEEMTDIVPVLREIASGKVIDAGVKELVSDLIVAIQTFGAVNETSLHTFSEAMKKQLKAFEILQQTNDRAEKDQPSQTKDETCEQVQQEPQDTEMLSAPREKVGSFISKPDGDLEASFSEALEEVFDPSPALKGGSIRYLTKCIGQKLPLAMQNIEKIAGIFFENLDHKDSFVFLSAVQGLAVIATDHAQYMASENLLENIVKKYFQHGTPLDSNSDSEIEIRMKLGEVIVRIIKAMGDMGPHFASVLLPEFLRAARHPNPDVRASSLSNFAELAPMAPYYLTQIQHEIGDCLCGIAKSDTDPLVRRSATFAIHQIISELGDKLVSILSDVIRDFYHLLKNLYQHDNDNSVQLHAQLALEQLDEIMRNSIFKPSILSKKITVLPT